MLYVKEVVGYGTNGYSNGKTEGMTVFNEHGAVIHSFTNKETFTNWSKKLGFKLDKNNSKSNFTEILNKKVVNYQVNHTIKEDWIEYKEDIPTEVTKVCGNVCGTIVFCYIKVEGNQTIIYRPKPQGDWFEALPQPVQDLIMVHGVRPADFV